MALLKQLARRWSADEIPRRAAALAFYTFLGLSPLLIIIVSLLGLLYGKSGAEADIIGQTQSTFGDTAASALATIIENANSGRSGVIGLVGGSLLLILSATGIFSELQADLNLIWRVRDRPHHGLAKILIDRFFTLIALIGIGVLLLASIVASTLVAGLADELGGELPAPAFFLQAAEFLASLALVTALAAFLFKVLPATDARWRDVLLGAFFTAFLFGIGKLAIGLYLGRSGMASSYGAAAGFIILLLWVYYSAQILLFGAEFTALYASGRGDVAGERAAGPEPEGGTPGT